jgi:hypothetical protein
LDTS